MLFVLSLGRGGVVVPLLDFSTAPPRQLCTADDSFLLLLFGATAMSASSSANNF